MVSDNSTSFETEEEILARYFRAGDIGTTAELAELKVLLAAEIRTETVSEIKRLDARIGGQPVVIINCDDQDEILQTNRFGLEDLFEPGSIRLMQFQRPEEAMAAYRSLNGAPCIYISDDGFPGENALKGKRCLGILSKEAEKHGHMARFICHTGEDRGSFPIEISRLVKPESITGPVEYQFYALREKAEGIGIPKEVIEAEREREAKAAGKTLDNRSLRARYEEVAGFEKHVRMTNNPGNYHHEGERYWKDFVALQKALIAEITGKQR